MTTSATTQTLIDGITAWMQCESPTSSPAGVAAMVADMARYALEGGLQATVTPLGERVGPLVHVTNRAAGDTRPGLLVLGHSDTLHPVGTLSDNPCRIEGDRFYGPGGYDMKAGIYLAMTALRDLAAAGASAMPIDFVVVPDEETGSHASRVHIERFAHNARYALVCEPAGKLIASRMKRRRRSFFAFTKRILPEA